MYQTLETAFSKESKTLFELLNFIESFKSEPRHRSDFHEGTPKYNNNNNVIINILDQIYASFKKLW